MTENERMTAWARDYGTALAAALGDGWTYVVEQGYMPRAIIKHEDGRQLYCAHLASRRRVEIIGILSGMYQYAPSGVRLTITVSTTKAATTVAREIERRLMPEYVRVRALCIAAKKKNDDYHALSIQNAMRIARDYGGEYRNPHGVHDHPTVHFGDGVLVTVSGDSYSFESFSVEGQRVDELLAVLTRKGG